MIKGQAPRRAWPLGRVAGLAVSALPLALIGTLLLTAILAGVGWRWLGLGWGEALRDGLVATLLYWLSELVHNLGHAWVARREGHPMVGLRLWFLLATLLYPEDEPPLPAALHIRRALGGPAASSLLMLAAGVGALALYPLGGLPFWLVLWLFADNLLVFSLGTFLPLGFNDGSTLLYWSRRA